MQLECDDSLITNVMIHNVVSALVLSFFCKLSEARFRYFPADLFLFLSPNITMDMLQIPSETIAVKIVSQLVTVRNFATVDLSFASGLMAN